MALKTILVEDDMHDPLVILFLAFFPIDQLGHASATSPWTGTRLAVGGEQGVGFLATSRHAGQGSYERHAGERRRSKWEGPTTPT